MKKTSGDTKLEVEKPENKGSPFLISSYLLLDLGINQAFLIKSYYSLSKRVIMRMLYLVIGLACAIVAITGIFYLVGLNNQNELAQIMSK